VLIVMASNLSFGSGFYLGFGSSRLTWSRQRPFGPGSCPYPAGYARPAAEGPPWSSRFPVAFRRTGVRFLTILFPLGGSAFLTVGSPGRLAARTPSGFPRSAPVRHDRAGCPLYPGDGGVLPAGGSAVRPAPAASQRPVPAPRWSLPPVGAQLDEASSRVHLRSPVRSSPCLWPPDGTEALGLVP